jgi:hypothetical protein
VESEKVTLETSTGNGSPIEKSLALATYPASGVITNVTVLGTVPVKTESPVVSVEVCTVTV